MLYGTSLIGKEVFVRPRTFPEKAIEREANWTLPAVLRMLGTMRHLRHRCLFAARGAALLAVAAAYSAVDLQAQTPVCTTQARMTPAQRQEIGTAAFSLASAVQVGDLARVQAGSTPAAGADASQSEYIVRNTAAHIRRDTLQVTQIYLLDATGRPANENTPAAFGCPLQASVSEIDFAIPGLPPGRFAFALVEAQGAEPWQLAFLLQASAGSWRMAGFYPHAASAAGHNGLWYWKTARLAAKEDKPWLAWMYYGEADRLLRPVNFLSSTNLEKLRTEQRSAAPQPLVNGIGVETPLALQGAGAVYLVTRLEARGSEDGSALNLYMEIQAARTSSTEADPTQRNLRAAEALLSAHPELRPAFTHVEVVAEVPGGNPIILQRSMAEIQGGAR